MLRLLDHQKSSGLLFNTLSTVWLIRTEWNLALLSICMKDKKAILTVITQEPSSRATTFMPLWRIGLVRWDKISVSTRRWSPLRRPLAHSSTCVVIWLSLSTMGLVKRISTVIKTSDSLLASYLISSISMPRLSKRKSCLRCPNPSSLHTNSSPLQTRLLSCKLCYKKRLKIRWCLRPPRSRLASLQRTSLSSSESLKQRTTFSPVWCYLLWMKCVVSPCNLSDSPTPTLKALA